jgi:hypothetical protein
MIIKATRHRNGAKLAAYMMSGGKHGKRLDRVELRGFGPYADDIFKAFRSLHVMADASEIENPLFHVQVRLPDHEQITQEQWERTADRIQKRLGLTGQARAVVYHILDVTGDRHMHLAFSLIDEETLKAKQLPFFKLRLKALSRELEEEFDITRVKNYREGPIQYAAKKNEQQQAQRLGTNKDELRNTIRACWDQSDCGRSFESALAHEGMILAQGDRRGLVVVDHAGGVHAVGKRILDVNKSQMLQRLSDLDLNELPTVQHAQSCIRELAEVNRSLYGPSVADMKRELEEVDKVIRAGLKKNIRVGREQEQPFFEEATTRDIRTENLTGEAAKVWKAWREIDRAKHEKDSAALDDMGIPFSAAPDAKAFAAALDAKGISFAVVTNEEACRSHREAEFARAVGNTAQRFKEGEIVIVTEPRAEYRRDGQIFEPPRVHKLDPALADKFVAALDNRNELQGIDETIKISDTRAQERVVEREAFSLDRATSPSPRGAENPLPVSTLANAGSRVIDEGLSVIGGGLSLVEKAVDALFDLLDPPTPPMQQEQAVDKAMEEREAQAERISFANYATMRQREELERQEDRQRGERER